MQKQPYSRQNSAAKAITVDNRTLLIKIRLLQLLAVILSAALGLGLHIIFAH